MACVISATSSNSGKTLLSLLLISWLKSINKTVQTFKVGPDYLDPQQLTAVSKKACRNLDLILSGENWVKENFNYFGGLTDYSFVEGVTGFFVKIFSFPDSFRDRNACFTILSSMECYDMIIISPPTVK